jgi:hypothetical protein
LDEWKETVPKINVKVKKRNKLLDRINELAKSKEEKSALLPNDPSPSHPD